MLQKTWFPILTLADWTVSASPLSYSFYAAFMMHQKLAPFTSVLAFFSSTCPKLSNGVGRFSQNFERISILGKCIGLPCRRELKWLNRRVRRFIYLDIWPGASFSLTWLAADGWKLMSVNTALIVLYCWERSAPWSARQSPVAGVLDEPYSQLIPLNGVAVQARQST
jgi:hypothetical protein